MDKSSILYDDDGSYTIYRKEKDFIHFDTLISCWGLYPFDLHDKGTVDYSIDSWFKFIFFLLEEKELTAFDKSYCVFDKNLSKDGYFPYVHTEENQGSYFLIEELITISNNYRITTQDNFEIHIDKINELRDFILKCHKQKHSNGDKIMAINKTAKATEVRLNNQLMKWQKAFRYMVEIRDIILQDGKKKRTERELWKMFESKGYEISKTQMTYFKTLLPHGFVDREGGAPRQ